MTEIFDETRQLTVEWKRNYEKVFPLNCFSLAASFVVVGFNCHAVERVFCNERKQKGLKLLFSYKLGC